MNIWTYKGTFADTAASQDDDLVLSHLGDCSDLCGGKGMSKQGALTVNFEWISLQSRKQLKRRVGPS